VHRSKQGHASLIGEVEDARAGNLSGDVEHAARRRRNADDVAWPDHDVVPALAVEEFLELDADDPLRHELGGG
jgi:hypothetical protein